MASSHLILRLCGGIRSVGNFSLLLVVLAAFPFLLSFTVGFGVAEAAPQNPQQRGVFVKAYLVLIGHAFAWRQSEPNAEAQPPGKK